MEELRSHLVILLRRAAQRLMTLRSCYHPGEEREGGDGVTGAQVIQRDGTQQWSEILGRNTLESFFLPCHLSPIDQTQL